MANGDIVDWLDASSLETLTPCDGCRWPAVRRRDRLHDLGDLRRRWRQPRGRLPEAEGSPEGGIGREEVLDRASET